MRLICHFIVLLLSIMCLSTGCQTASSCRVDPDSEPTWQDSEANSKDLRTVTQRMARSLIQTPVVANAQTPPRIAVMDIKNKTSQYLDTSIMSRSIQSMLIKYSSDRIRFIDREQLKKVMQEREMKRDGLVGSSGEKTLSGADFFLFGEVNSLDKAYRSNKSTYTVFFFRLVDAESSDIVWEDSYEIKKVAKSGLWDR